MTLLICPVRPGDSNEELRFAMRSWEANLVMPDGLTLMTVGHCPPWLKPDHHIDGNQYTSMPLAVLDNVRRGATEAIVMNEASVVFMNDDFFCMDPLAGLLPVKRNCTLAAHIAQFPANAGVWWPRSLRLTASWLASEGYPSPDSYEVHRPLLAKSVGMVWAIERWLGSPGGGMSGDVPQWRTLYGVLNEVDAYPVADAKIGNKVTGVGSPWISTSDQNWRRYATAMSKRFQKPSRWEI